MRSVSRLPEGYAEFFSVDLQKNKRVALLINGLALVIAAVMAVIGVLIVPFTKTFEVEEGQTGLLFVRLGALLAGMVLYMILHEAVHGLAMRMCGSKKLKFGFTGLYAFAGSDDYYPKGSYIFIALAPVVLWGIVLSVICLLVPRPWFWVVYIIQISNISGAMGDAYVTCKFLRMPKDILVQDKGVGMKVYSQDRTE